MNIKLSSNLSLFIEKINNYLISIFESFVSNLRIYVTLS